MTPPPMTTTSAVVGNMNSPSESANDESEIGQTRIANRRISEWQMLTLTPVS